MPNMTFADQLRTPRNEHCRLDHTPKPVRRGCGPRSDARKTARHRPRTPEPHRLCLAHIPLRGITPLTLTLARYREAFTPSRAKDDPTDAALQLALLRPHRAKLPPLKPQSPAMRALVQRLHTAERVIGDTVRSTHRLPSTLKNYFPQVRQWLQDKDTGIFVTFSAAGQPAGCSTRPPLSPGDLLSRAPCALGGCYCTRINAIKAAIP